MKSSSARAVLLTLLLSFLLLQVACEKNEKLSLADGDVDTTDAPVDGDTDMEAVEEDPYLKIESVHKWHNPHGSILSLGSDSILWSVSNAGIIGLDSSGTPDDESDDIVLMHNELTLPAWPTETIVSSCIDGSGSLWLATQNDFFIFAHGADLEDASDDTLVAGNMEGLDAVIDIRQLLCRKDGAGVWIATGAGFVAVDQSADPVDPAQWTRNSFAGGDNVLASAPYVISFDGSQWLWLTVFIEDSLKLFAIDTQSATSSGDTGIVPITPGFADTVQISYLAVDSDKGLWMVNGERTFYFKHGGSIADSSDDEWIELLAGTELGLSAIFPAEEGLAFGMKGESAFYRLDANNVAIKKMADMGFNTENPIKSMFSAGENSLWYSSKKDFGIIGYVDDQTDSNWTIKRYTRTGGVPANDLSGFAFNDKAVYMGGPTAVCGIEYDENTEVADFAFSSWPLNVPDGAALFGAQALSIVDGGILVGGARPAYISEGGASSVWNENNSPTNIYYISANQGDFVWIGSAQIIAGVAVPWFYVYDTNGSLKKSSDDECTSYSNDYFGGLEAGPINDVDFIGDNSAIFANDLGLFGINFGENKLDPEDLTIEVGLLGETQSIRSVTSAGNGCFWIGSLRKGLSYLDTKGTAAKDDDEFLHYENVKLKSYEPALDKNGRLYYVVNEGIMVHDPMGTPLDDTDDMGIIISTGRDQKPEIAIDGKGGIWFSYQDNSGIYLARLSDGDLKPWAEIWPEESTAK